MVIFYAQSSSTVLIEFETRPKTSIVTSDHSNASVDVTTTQLH